MMCFPTIKTLRHIHDAAQTMSNYRTTFHRDQTVTVWDVYQQQWRRLPAVRLFGEDAIMASLNQQERNRVVRAAAKAGSKAAQERADARA